MVEIVRHEQRNLGRYLMASTREVVPRMYLARSELCCSYLRMDLLVLFWHFRTIKLSHDRIQAKSVWINTRCDLLPTVFKRRHLWMCKDPRYHNITPAVNYAVVTTDHHTNTFE
jgi:hypothetical protein